MIRVLYPGPGLLSSAAWPSMLEKHSNGLIHHNHLQDVVRSSGLWEAEHGAVLSGHALHTAEDAGGGTPTNPDPGNDPALHAHHTAWPWINGTFTGRVYLMTILFEFKSLKKFQWSICDIIKLIVFWRWMCWCIQIGDSNGIMTEKLVIHEIRINKASGRGDEFRGHNATFNSNQLWKPYCKMRCIAAAGNSWKRMTCLYKGKIAVWSLKECQCPFL